MRRFERVIPAKPPRQGVNPFTGETHTFPGAARPTECIDSVWELRRLLERAGFTVSALMTTSPGAVVFQDELQIAALRPATDPNGR
ncbi:MAG: hypothetical protein ACRENE_20745 [Polyangiaceae bacterium]